MKALGPTSVGIFNPLGRGEGADAEQNCGFVDGLRNLWPRIRTTVGGALTRRTRFATCAFDEDHSSEEVAAGAGTPLYADQTLRGLRP
jgi:hypothetical protein